MKIFGGSYTAYLPILALVVLILLATPIKAQSTSKSKSNSDSGDDEEDALAAARELWASFDLDQYAVWYRNGCVETSCSVSDPAFDNYRVRVMNDMVVGVEDEFNALLDDATDYVMTVEELFTLIEESLADTTISSVEVAYDPTYGYPRIIRIDEDGDTDPDTEIFLNQIYPYTLWMQENFEAYELWVDSGERGSYTFTYSEPTALSESYVLVVEGGEIISVDGVAVDEVDDSITAVVQTIDAVFEEIEAAIQAWAITIQVSYDDQFGYPTNTQIDFDQLAGDDTRIVLFLGDEVAPTAAPNGSPTDDDTPRRCVQKCGRYGCYIYCFPVDDPPVSCRKVCDGTSGGKGKGRGGSRGQESCRTECHPIFEAEELAAAPNQTCRKVCDGSSGKGKGSSKGGESCRTVCTTDDDSPTAAPAVYPSTSQTACVHRCNHYGCYIDCPHAPVAPPTDPPVMSPVSVPEKKCYKQCNGYGYHGYNRGCQIVCYDVYPTDEPHPTPTVEPHPMPTEEPHPTSPPQPTSEPHPTDMPHPTDEPQTEGEWKLHCFFDRYGYKRCQWYWAH